MPEPNNKRIERVRRPGKCPSCGFKPMGVILYGMPIPTEQYYRDVESGKLIVGGCSLTDDDPKWECRNCGQQIFKKETARGESGYDPNNG